MKNGEPITTEQLVNKDKQQLDHYNNSLMCGRYTLEQRTHKREKRDRIFKHELYLIMNRHAGNEVQGESPRKTGE